MSLNKPASRCFLPVTLRYFVSLFTVNDSTKYFEITGKKQRQAGKLNDIHAGTALMAAGSYDARHNFDAALVAYRSK